MQCKRHVSWWSGEYEGECQLEAGHDGPHEDELGSRYDDDGDEVD